MGIIVNPFASKKVQSEMNTALRCKSPLKETGAVANWVICRGPFMTWTVELQGLKYRFITMDLIIVLG